MSIFEQLYMIRWRPTISVSLLFGTKDGSPWPCSLYLTTITIPTPTTITVSIIYISINEIILIHVISDLCFLDLLDLVGPPTHKHFRSPFLLSLIRFDLLMTHVSRVLLFCPDLVFNVYQTLTTLYFTFFSSTLSVYPDSRNIR